MTEHSETFTGWAVVEMLGHKRLAGCVSEQVIAGAALVRVDVPETLHPRRVDGYGGTVVEAKAGYTKLIGVGSIYCITPVTEEIARRCATELERFNDPVPVPLPRLLVGGSPTAQDIADATFDEFNPEDRDEDGR